MAKITINADTETDTLDVSIDGRAIVDVSSIGIYFMSDYYSRKEKELSVNIMSFTEDENSGVKTYTTLVAADTSEGQDLKDRGAKVKGEFVVLKNSDKIKYDLLEQFGGR